MAEEPQERPRNRGKTRADMLNVLVRRQFVFQLRRRGATYETIFQAARQRFGAQLPKSYDRRQVHKDVLAELTHLRTELAEDVEAVRHLELDRLDNLFMAIWPKAIGTPADMQRGLPAVPPDLDAQDMILKIMARRARYLPGLEAPMKVAPTNPAGTEPWDPSAYITDAFCEEVAGLLAQYGQIMSNGHADPGPATNGNAAPGPGAHA